MERDDIIEYSLGAQHSEEEGAKIRKENMESNSTSFHNHHC